VPDALVIIDMQVAGFPPGEPRHDANGVVARINDLAGWIRGRRGLVIWVQHDGPKGDAFEPETPGWRILPALQRRAGDETVRKTACDSFLGTGLEALLRERGVARVIVTGWATDFCVDTTVRASTGRGFETWAVADGHTCGDRPHLAAEQVIRHHNWVWMDLIAPGGPVRVVEAEALMRS
jgi:nicotinamidase-related amidase